MTTEEALLAAIWASPHDDLPRLVYADWLDETGDPAKAARAEFIRVQCELAKLSGRQDERWRRLQAAESGLLKQFGWVFRGEPFGDIAKAPFHRGFLSPGRRGVDVNELLDWSDTKFARAPLWRFDVNFRHSTAAREYELFASPRLRQLEHLGLRRTYDRKAVALAESPHTVNLTSLCFRGTELTAFGIRAFAHSPNLPHLRELELSFYHIVQLDIQLARELAHSPLAERLKRLDLRNCDHIDPDVRDLLTEKFPGRLLVGDRFT